MTKKLKVLVAPLDWGMGHATRCIPVINFLLQEGHDVVMAGEGEVANVLQQNFPTVPTIPLEGYRIRYSRSKETFFLKIFAQVPRLIRAILRERKWLQRCISDYSFDLVISDNRYGLYSGKVPCVILTHQLQILSGMGVVANNLLRFLNYRLLQNFDACWVVDEPGDNGMGGELSHPRHLPNNSRYIGLLSQFKRCAGAPRKQDDDLILILLSGPEPMRSILEQKLLSQASTLVGYQIVIAAGRPSASLPDALPAHLTYFPFLNANRLADYLERASLVVCRSGYTTLMDLALFGKKALLVPTPGQTEQEYLGSRLAEKGICLARSQASVELANDIPLALTLAGFAGKEQIKRDERLREAIADLVRVSPPIRMK